MLPTMSEVWCVEGFLGYGKWNILYNVLILSGRSNHAPKDMESRLKERVHHLLLKKDVKVGDRLLIKLSGDGTKSVGS